MRRLRYAGLLFGSVSLLAFNSACSTFGTRPSDQDKKRFAESPHYKAIEDRFVNSRQDIMDAMKVEWGFMDSIKFWIGPMGERIPAKPLPTVSPVFAEFMQPSDNIKAIWFGHSSFLLNMKGKTVLIDPVLSSYAAPFSFLVHRFQPTVAELKDLPRIDYIVISHDHYDHLDIATVEFYQDKGTEFVVPLGVGGHIRGWGVPAERVTELDWWQSKKVEGLEFIATPSQHFSGRTLNKRNETQWAGWVVKNDTQSIFYSGDSGYDTHFKAIGERLGPFDIAFVENGQYNPQWRLVHLLPDETIQAFKDVKAKHLVPVHWGAFTIAPHSWYDPIVQTAKRAEAEGLSLISPKIGQTVEVNEHWKSETWWQDLIPKATN